ncbi:MAG: (Fe-S)-binding protein [Planctomycetota bacterium]|nr:MAG: (Fe-S)-binding protein [Planctomycetota bacterium]
MKINSDLFGIPGWILAILILLPALEIFFVSLYCKIHNLTIGNWEDRFQNLSQRLKDVLVYMFAQKRLFKYPLVGLMHALIFWGFCILSLRAVSIIAAGFHFPFVHSLFSTPLGLLYLFVKDIFALIVLICVTIALVRRLVFRPDRLHHSYDAIFILCMIATIMLTDFAMEGAFFQLEPNSPTKAYSPISALLSHLLSSLPPTTLLAIFKTSLWLHILVILGFLNYLPYSKHFHVITALPNILSRNSKPMGKIEKMNLEDETAESFGTGKVWELSWKNILDVYTCTECGRCHDHCPAWRSDKPLSPMNVNITLRNHINQNANFLMDRKQGKVQPNPNLENLVGELLHPDIIWSCTTCGYCEDACPLLIENFQRFIGMRQFKVLTEGDFPEETITVFEAMENQGNPWGMNPQERNKWAENLNIKQAQNGNFEILYYVGCAGSFDKRAQKVSQAIVKILQTAKVDFAILGNQERCHGEAARRIGNEYLYQSMAIECIETLQNCGAKKILTTCPHCFNTIKHEFPDFGGHFEVIHHSQFIQELLQSKRLKLKNNLPKELAQIKDKLIYHDSCYMGRHNGVYQAPRQVLANTLGTAPKEFQLHKSKSFCCGAGGGRMWMEETIGKRINHIRLQQAEESAPDAQVIGLNCPFCMTMFEDAITTQNKENQLKAMDIAEIVALCLDEEQT